MTQRLAEFQRWLVESITGSVPVSERTASLKPSANISSKEALFLYRDTYRRRLQTTIHAVYPATVAALGKESFGEIAEAYLVHRPPCSPTLRDFGDGFADYLRLRAEDSFVCELAEFERQMCEVIHASSGLRRIAEREPFDDHRFTLRVRFSPAAGARVLALTYPTNAYYERWCRDGDTERPAPAITGTALWRKGLAIRRMDVPRDEIAPLTAVLRGLSLWEQELDIVELRRLAPRLRLWSRIGLIQ